MLTPIAQFSLFLFLFPFLSIIAQDSLKTVIAQKGDGIYALLRKEGINPADGFDEFVSLNIENLRDSIHLYEGKAYLIPGIPSGNSSEISGDVASVPSGFKKQRYPIFGADYERVPDKSNRLDGTIFYLVSGHGGPDPGAMTDYDGHRLAEDEYAYDITLRLARELIAHGALVYIIIRDEDDGIRDERLLETDKDEVAYPDEEIPLNQLARLKQRVDIVNELYSRHKGRYQRLIVTHIDSRNKGQNIDVFFYHHENSKNGRNLAESIHKTFQKNYARYQPNRSYSGTFEDRTNLYLVKKTHPAMTFIEIGNIRNTADQKRILQPENRQALAKWIGEGALLDYENHPK